MEKCQSGGQALLCASLRTCLSAVGECVYRTAARKALQICRQNFPAPRTIKQSKGLCEGSKKGEDRVSHSLSLCVCVRVCVCEYVCCYSQSLSVPPNDVFPDLIHRFGRYWGEEGTHTHPCTLTCSVLTHPDAQLSTWTLYRQHCTDDHTDTHAHTLLNTQSIHSIHTHTSVTHITFE